MSRDQVVRRCRGPLGRLSQPGSAAGLAALLALTMPQLADSAIADLGLTVIAVSAAVVAMVKCECRDCNGR